MPANLFYYLKGFRITTLYFLPNIFAQGLKPNYVNQNVPVRIA